ncbi:hypothetical protein RchiOBHm_Chr4g0405101 [Rosa chinensis]|uniref:Uncharacterized protein n=1 Tax=Rosa chinensis TaxID=74649 RepID=A0A2P6QTZ6_ROSCH|nr:hypothetical protein RchiOBHm_Chr4g0405101 [Rosa chinensis]
MLLLFILFPLLLLLSGFVVCSACIDWLFFAYLGELLSIFFLFTLEFVFSLFSSSYFLFETF